jgi:hypothetical protein
LPSVDSQITLQRAAVDAIAEGRYSVAAQLYGTLAQAHPGNLAYREAARVLSERTRSNQ